MDTINAQLVWAISNQLVGYPQFEPIGTIYAQLVCTIRNLLVGYPQFKPIGTIYVQLVWTIWNQLAWMSPIQTNWDQLETI